MPGRPRLCKRLRIDRPAAGAEDAASTRECAQGVSEVVLGQYLPPACRAGDGLGA